MGGDTAPTDGRGACAKVNRKWTSAMCMPTLGPSGVDVQRAATRPCCEAASVDAAPTSAALGAPGQPSAPATDSRRESVRPQWGRDGQDPGARSVSATSPLGSVAPCEEWRRLRRPWRSHTRASVCAFGCSGRLFVPPRDLRACHTIQTISGSRGGISHASSALIVTTPRSYAHRRLDGPPCAGLRKISRRHRLCEASMR